MLLNVSESHQFPQEANTAFDVKLKSFEWLREKMLYPALKRVSAPMTAKSSPAIATMDLKFCANFCLSSSIRLKEF